MKKNNKNMKNHKSYKNSIYKRCKHYISSIFNKIKHIITQKYKFTSLGKYDNFDERPKCNKITQNINLLVLANMTILINVLNVIK